MKTKMWFLRCTPTWQWNPVRADNISGDPFEMLRWSLAIWGRGEGRSVMITIFCLHCQCISFGQKRKKCKQIQTMRMEMEWILNSNSKEREYKLHLSLNLTKTQVLAMGLTVSVEIKRSKRNGQKTLQDIWDCQKDILVYFYTRFWKQQ